MEEASHRICAIVQLSFDIEAYGFQAIVLEQPQDPASQKAESFFIPFDEVVGCIYTLFAIFMVYI